MPLYPKHLVAGFFAFWVLSALSAGAALTPSALRCESQVDPLGVDAAQPQLRWLLQSSQRGDAQSAYQVLVASTSTLLAANTGDLWDSGKVISDSPVQIPYAGTALVTAQKVYWKVRVWDVSDAASAWSATATWTMGVLNPSDWTGQWITPSTAATDVGSSLLRKNFTVAAGLTRAVVFVSGLGQCEMTVNGTKASPDFLSPGWSMYNKTVLYTSYDITALLPAGANAVGLNLGNGMYNIPSNSGRYTKITQSFGPRKAIAQIRLEYANGTVQTVATDATWKWSAGPITFNTIYGGEAYDARQEQPGWDLPTFNDASWNFVTTTTGPGGTLRGASFSAPPVRTQETLNVVTPALNGTASRVVYDLGQNAAQTPTITVHGSAGATVTLTPSELGSAGVNGSISPIVSPCYLTYTLKGSTAAAPETFTPRFFYTGYRYLQVQLSSGATLDGLTSAVIQSNSDAAGNFTCSNTLFNSIRTLVRWAQRSNEVSIFTDCPTREKLGWLEQNYLNGPSLRYEFDVSSLFSSMMQSMADSQTGNGVIPTTAPAYLGSSGDFGDTPEWGSNFILSAWQQYEFTGDVRLLSQYYSAMKAYLAYLGTRSSGYIVSYGLGDWYDLGPNAPGYAQLTPVALTATATYYRDVWTVAQIAQVLVNTADVATYNTLAGNIRTAFNNNFYNASTGSYGTGSQTSNSMPLELGMVDPANLTKVEASFIQSIRIKQNAMTSGDIGMSYMLPALTDIGRADVGFDMHTRTTSPGYGYILSRGATSMTEGWDGSNSQDHFMLGHITEWFYRHLAGIQPDITGPGFKKIIIRPQIVGDLTYAQATYQSVRGPIASNWTLSGTQLTLTVSVPPGSTATVYVPTLGTSPGALNVQESGTTIWQNGAATGSVANVTFDHVESGTPLQSSVAWAVGSGNYTFTAALVPVPGGLTATPGNQQVTLNWSAPAGATGYNVKRSTTSGGPYVTIASNLNATTFADTTVVDGTTYYYVVTRLSAAGESANSLEASAGSVPNGNNGFEYPTLSGFLYNPANALWTFTAQNGNNGSGICANNSGFTSSNSVAPEGTQVAFLQSASTISKSFKTVPGLAYTVTFSAAQRVSTNVNGQTWDLRKDGATLASYAPAQTATAYTDYTATFVASASSHTLAFVGTDTRGGDNTIFIDNVRLTDNGAPGNLTAAADNQKVTLVWSPSPGATGYNVKRSTTIGGPYATIASNLNATAFSDLNVARGTTYYYVVSALLPGGESANSAQASVAFPGDNLGFELPKLSTYQYNPSGGNWTFTAQSGSNGSGISANSSAFTSANPVAPEGAQVAFLQGLSTISQSFGTTPGVTYTITFSAAQRAGSNGNGQTWDLRKDGATIASYAPAQTATAYTDYTATFVASASSHTLAFVGTDTRGGDNTVFIDNVRIVASAPTAPPSLTATGGNGTISLNWAAVAGASAYSVKSAPTTGGPYTLVATGLNTPSFVNIALADGTTWFYVVTATNEGGESVNSNEASATTYTAIMKWRLANFGTTQNTGNAADTADPDGDGMTNAQEFAAGTSPNDSSSCLKISQFSQNGSGWLISFSSVSGKTYRLEYSSTLQSGSWTTVQDTISGTGGIIQITDPTLRSTTKNFYRVVLLP